MKRLVLKRNEIITSLFLVILVTIFLLLIFHMETVADYLFFHSYVELFSSLVGISIAYFGFRSFIEKRNARLLIFSTAFLTFSIMDLIYASVYPGINNPILRSNIDSALYFWLLGKLGGTILLLIFTIIPEEIHVSSGTKSLSLTMLATGAFVITSIYVIENFIDLLPRLFVVGGGSTLVKANLDFLIISLLTATSGIYIWKNRDEMSRSKIFYVFGLVALTLSQVFFMIFVHPFDILKMIGHIFKFPSYYSFMYGLLLVGRGQLDQFLITLSTRKMPKREIERVNAFSKLIGLNHEELIGRSLLLEYDPTTDYENRVLDFVSEGLDNNENVYVLTKRGSALYPPLARMDSVGLFLLTPKVTSPKTTDVKNEMLIPSNNTTLILDTFNRLLDIHSDTRVSIVFDNLTDLLLSIGFDKTYAFTRYSTELLALPRITSIFLMNSNAHDQKTTASIRGLFTNQVIYDKGGVKILKLESFPKKSF